MQSDLTARGGTITAFAISSDMIDITIRPDDPTRHKNIIIDLAAERSRPKQRSDSDYSGLRHASESRKVRRRMVLYRCNVTAATPTLEVLETYDFVQLGACNLVVHDGNVHFVEHPRAASKFKPINPDLAGYYTDERKNKNDGVQPVA